MDLLIIDEFPPTLKKISEKSDKELGKKLRNIIMHSRMTSIEYKFYGNKRQS